MTIKNLRFATASWMLVPIVLAAPAAIAGLSLWFDWGPQWPGLAIVLAGWLLALVLDFSRALRFGLIGAVVGLLTCPLLLLLDQPAWYLFATWILGVSALPALLIPLLLNPPESTRASSFGPQMTRREADGSDSMVAPPAHGD